MSETGKASKTGARGADPIGGVWARLGPVVPVVVVHSAEEGVQLARALLAGGIEAIEVTLRTPAAFDAARRIRAEVPKIQVGVGTVVDPRQFAEAKAGDLSFAVSPGYTRGLIDAARESGLPWLPGVATVSEALTIRAAGFTAAKLFPASQLGGVGVLKAWSAVLPEMSFCPTGGVSADNMGDYLALRAVFAVGGSWLAPRAAVEAGDWQSVTRLAREALAAAKAARRGLDAGGAA